MPTYIWHAHVDAGAPDSVHCILLDELGDTIADGTREFAQALFDALGVDARAERWEIKPYRSSYFSDFLDSDDWRDVWQVVWSAHLTADRAVELEDTGEPIVETEAEDDSWTDQKRVRDDARLPCLVIADFDDEEERARARSRVEGRALQAARGEAGAPPPAFHEAEVADGVRQLQVDLGPFDSAFYAEGSGYAVRVREACERAGGTVNYQDRFA
ncbi:MAG: hypothetical protein ABW277_16015 [Longimicrobiaceae bacterium]